MSPSKSPVQQCPICRAYQPLEATRCSNCGAALTGIPVEGVTINRGKPRRASSRPTLGGPTGRSWGEGPADLHEGMVPGLPRRLITFAVAFIGLATIGAFFSGVQTGL